ncbi:MAG: K(+)-transporting ATPase subunit C [Fibrobacteres bacterium]|jgi:K+-transporting ATPase ATPase C chain|nr:K(+)-transporting ATPase subunit C [Fibrobacterota bacterium]
MDSWKNNLRPALAITVLLTVATGILYPLAVWGASLLLFPDQAGGSLVRSQGRVVGSLLIAQASADSGMFHPRPSVAGSGYAGESSSGSNAGPLNRVLLDTLLPARVAAYRAENGLPADRKVPASSVSASGSGLDPDITLEDALIQAVRVARVRRLDPKRLTENVVSNARDDLWQPGMMRPVNVLELNLALESGADLASSLPLESGNRSTGGVRDVP